MTEMLIVTIGVLVSVIVFQQWFFLGQINTLINKIMSRNYTEFVKAETPPPPRIRVAGDPPEDLGPMAEYAAR